VYPSSWRSQGGLAAGEPETQKTHNTQHQIKLTTAQCVQLAALNALFHHMQYEAVNICDNKQLLLSRLLFFLFDAINAELATVLDAVRENSVTKPPLQRVDNLVQAYDLGTEVRSLVGLSHLCWSSSVWYCGFR
jgi:hypothetical protein